MVNPLIARFVDLANTGRKSEGNRRRAAMVAAATAAAELHPTSVSGIVASEV